MPVSQCNVIFLNFLQAPDMVSNTRFPKMGDCSTTAEGLQAVCSDAVSRACGHPQTGGRDRPLNILEHS
jgi:hypothetical protein